MNDFALRLILKQRQKENSFDLYNVTGSTLKLETANMFYLQKRLIHSETVSL